MVEEENTLESTHGKSVGLLLHFNSPSFVFASVLCDMSYIYTPSTKLVLSASMKGLYNDENPFYFMLKAL